MAKERNKSEKVKEEADLSLLEFRNKSDKKKRQLKSAALLAFNVLVILAIVIVEVTSNREKADIGTVLVTWGANWQYLLGFLGAVLLFYISLGLRMVVLIFAMTKRRRLKLSFSTAILGKYYDNITPFGSGGQPFQMFNLGRKLDVGLSTSIPIANYLIEAMVFIAMAITAFILKSSIVASDFLRITAYIGIVVFALVPLSVILFSIFPRTIAKVAGFFVKILHKIHIVKDLDKGMNKVTNAVSNYSTSLKLVSSKWWALIIVILLSVVTLTSFNSIPYFVLKACGKDVNFIDTIALSFFAYASINIVPTPGGAGAAEGVFYVLFESLSGEFLFWGTMLWRFGVYYSSLISGFVVTIYQYIHAARKEKRNARAAALQTESGECISHGDFTGESSVGENSAAGENSAEQGDLVADESYAGENSTAEPTEGEPTAGEGADNANSEEFGESEIAEPSDTAEINPDENSEGEGDL